MKISIYGHSGSYNHGNEAIVRGVCEIFYKERVDLYSFYPEIDYKFSLDKICEIKPFFNTPKNDPLSKIIKKIKTRLKIKSKLLSKTNVKMFLKNIEGIYLLEAGDQYCENDDVRKFYAMLNKEITMRGGKTVMLGCTINEEFISQPKVIEDLNNYSAIIARESITYENLKKYNINTKVLLAPDPAFAMNMQEIELPKIFNADVVGINVGFLKQGNEKHYEMLIKNTKSVIDYIINETELNIALIPHVNWNERHSDFNTLNYLFKYSKESSRVEVIEENNAPIQKFIMSKCRFMIALRTHVAIPSIAAQTPTLVTGYKVKSSGIVKDIFPDDIKVLAHVASLKTEFDYINDFKWMFENEDKIRLYMKENIPNYINNIKIIKKHIEEIMLN